MKETGMIFGFGLPTRGPLAEPVAIKTLLAKAETLGLGYVSVSDHIVIPKTISPLYPYSDTGEPPFPPDGACLEQLTLMSYIAAVTSNIRILSSVMVVPHRNPVHTAKTIATIDVLSGGRVTIGCGAGWMEEEFEAIGTEPFKERGKVTDEYLEIFKELWTAESPSYQGKYNSFTNLKFEPKPVQNPHPPLWIGGESPAAKRRAVKHGDGWFPIGANPNYPLNTSEKFAAGLSSLKQMAAEHDRDPATLDLGFWSNWDHEVADRKTPQEGARHIMTGGSGAIIDDIGSLKDMGVEIFMFQLAKPDSLDASIASMERFADQVLSEF
jgi:probable F420-dependent oxidoreductase